VDCAPDLVSYDLAPPLARAGAAALDQSHPNAWFTTWDGPIRYEHKDVSITVGGGVAFMHGFLRIGGTKTDGGPLGAADGLPVQAWRRLADRP
jgi:ketosteroid isomerase-like protein